MAQTTERKLSGLKSGIVLSDSRDKTVTVAVDYQRKHPKYGKILHRQAKLHVHDEKNEARNGDRVEIAMCRPLSKTKSWRITRILVKAPGNA